MSDIFDIAVLVVWLALWVLALSVGAFICERKERRERQRRAEMWRTAHDRTARPLPIDQMVIRHLRGSR